MKTVKSLLLGSAAAFVAFTGAQAADLPMAEPVEYVRICDTYGKGFFYIPGTDTCLKVGGFVRFDQRYDFGDRDSFSPFDEDEFAGDEASERYSNRARLSIKLDARSETEWGTLRSFLEFRSDADSDEFQNGGDGNDFVESAYIQFAGFTVGRTSSFYDFVQTATVADFFSDNQVNTVAYTWSFGDGFSATVGIENAASRFLGPVTLIDFSPLGDGIEGTDNTRDAPAGIAALRVEQAWGSAQLSAAVKDNAGDDNIVTTDEADIGWAVQAGVAINLPTAVEGSYVWAQGTYAEGAADYGYLGTFLQTLTPRADFDLDGESTEQWAVGGGVNFQATETVALYGSAAYIDYDGKDGLEGSFEAIQAAVGILWKPVENLNIFLEGEYITVDHTDFTGLDVAGVAFPTDFEEDDLRIQSRIQRNF
ncbi:porin [Flaviflagellibacter deserti]|uniref:Porin n=1 Tax=Flaviflagellibacter deserti TaxID=2267266 RepID=A0ABV9YYM9_9HYPH